MEIKDLALRKKVKCEICFQSTKSRKEFLDFIYGNNKEILFIVSEDY